MFRHLRSSPWIAACAILLAALAIQLRSTAFHPAAVPESSLAVLADARALAEGTALGMPGFLPSPGALPGPAAGSPLYTLLLSVPLAAGANPLLTAAVFDAVLVAALAGMVVLFAAPTLGVLAASGAGLLLAIAPLFANPGALRLPGGALLLVLVMAALLLARRARTVPEACAVGVPIGLAALAGPPGLWLLPAFLLTSAIRHPAARRVPAFVTAASLVTAVCVALPCWMAGLVPADTTPFAARAPWHIPGPAAILAGLGTVWVPAPAPGWAVIAVPGLFLLAAVGFAARLRAVTMAETLLVLTLGAALGPSIGPPSPLAWVPVSFLLLPAALHGARALRPAGAPALVGVLLLLAVLAGQQRRLQDKADSLFDALTRDLDHMLPLTIGPNTLVLAHRAQALAFFTARSTTGLDLPATDPEFWPWAGTMRATHLVLTAADPAVRALLAAQHAPADAAHLGAALDTVEKSFFGPDRKGFFPLVDTGLWRLYKLEGLPGSWPPR